MAEGILRIKIIWLKMMKMFSFQRPATKPSVRLDECPPIRWVAEKPLGLRYICSKTPKKSIGTYNLLAQVGHFMIEKNTNTLEKVFARHYDSVFTSWFPNVQLLFWACYGPVASAHVSTRQVWYLAIGSCRGRHVRACQYLCWRPRHFPCLAPSAPGRFPLVSALRAVGFHGRPGLQGWKC